MGLKLFGKKSRIKHVIGIAAGKGGVGKSTITVNLALALKASGYNVGVLDADLYGPSIRTMLPEDQFPEEQGDLLFPAISHGIACMSIAYFFPSSQGSVVRAPIANSWINRFLQNVEWGDLDFLLIDFPPGTGDIQITLSQSANLTGAIIVTTPQEIALQDVRKCIYMFQQVNIPIAGIVENMSYYQQGAEKVYLFGKGGGEKLSKEANAPLVGQVPIEPLIGEHLDNGKSLFCSKNPLSDPLKECFLEIAEKVADFVKYKPENLAIDSITQKNPYSITIQWSDGFLQDCSLEKLQSQCPCAKCKENKAVFTVSSQDAGERDGSKRSGLTEEDMARAMFDEEDRSGEVVADRIPDEIVKIAEKEEIGAPQAKTVRKVGRYALQVDFTTGCSHGIYDFELIRKII